MNFRTLLICLLFILPLVVAVPAASQNEIYDNGPINGTTDAWTINFGFVVSNSFTIQSDYINVNGLTFGAWLYPGDVLQSVEVSITSDEFGGTTYFDQIVNFTQSNCVGNQYGFNVCTESGSWTDVSLNTGTYWLNLQNATVNTGDPVYWDENSGPSQASQNEIGTIPSESFTILGSTTFTTTCWGCCGSGANCIPEPSTLTLSSSGLLTIFGLLGALRRKLF